MSAGHAALAWDFSGLRLLGSCFVEAAAGTFPLPAAEDAPGLGAAFCAGGAAATGSLGARAAEQAQIAAQA